MNTRSKILAPIQAASLDPPRPLLLVTGRFDLLRAGLLRELADACRRTAAQSLAVVIRPLEEELAPAAARAEMAAALRMVDYVFVAGTEPLEDLIASLQPIEIIRLEASDEDRTRQLIEHVQRRPSR